MFQAFNMSSVRRSSFTVTIALALLIWRPGGMFIPVERPLSSHILNTNAVRLKQINDIGAKC